MAAPIWPTSYIAVPSISIDESSKRTGCLQWPLPSGYACKVESWAASRVSIPCGKGLEYPTWKFSTPLAGQQVHLSLDLALVDYADGLRG